MKLPWRVVDRIESMFEDAIFENSDSGIEDKPEGNSL